MSHNNRHYDVYANDLKFSEHIDPGRSIWQNNDVQQKFSTNEVKTLEYRLSECKKNNYEYLDISYLNLDSIPDLTKHKDYNLISNIKFLFANNNNIKNLNNSLKQFNALQVFDVSCNKLKEITNLPNTLTELMCHNNQLRSICSSNSLITLDCSFNLLKHLNKYQSVRTMLCENNKICELDSYSNVKHLSIKQNPLIKINTQPQLEFLNMEETLFQGSLDGMPNLTGLVCHSTGITNIEHLCKLKYIEMTNCTLKKIPYLQHLKEILCAKQNQLQIDPRMKLRNYLVEHENVYYIFN